MAFASGDLERELCRIPDVFAARVTVNGSGRATEARILATPERPAKRVRKDVQSVAMASFGVELPSSAISVTQLDQGSGREEEAPSEGREPPAAETPAAAPPGVAARDPGLPAGAVTEPEADFDGDEDADDGEDLGEPQLTAPGSAGRQDEEAPPGALPSPETVPPAAPAPVTEVAELVRVTVSTSSDRISASVELRAGRRRATGRASAAATEALTARAVAEAVLGAAGELALLAPGAGVDHAGVVQLGSARVAVVVAALPGPGTAVRLASGSFVVSGPGDHHALARSALAAALPPS